MKRKIHIKIMVVEPESDSDDGESVSDVMEELKVQMAQIDAMSKSLEAHVTDLYKRAKVETVDWMKEPLKPRRHIQKWCALHGLSERPTMDEFTDACFAAAWSTDLGSRVITFKKEDAAILWNGQRRMTVFDMIRLVPSLFE